MKDCIGRDLVVGDHVCFAPTGTRHLRVGKIIKFTKKMMHVEYKYSATSKNYTKSHIYSEDSALLPPTDVMIYLMSA